MEPQAECWVRRLKRPESLQGRHTEVGRMPRLASKIRMRTRGNRQTPPSRLLGYSYAILVANSPPTAQSQLMAEQAALGHGNVQVLVKESENVHIEIGGTKVASLWVPPFRQTPRSGKNLDLALLLATTAITDLAGRDALWRDCIAWCDDSLLGPVSVRCITGRGGSGKTRFALELLHHLRDLPDWDARFVRFAKSEPFDLWAKTSGKNHVLLVFDYAPDNAAAIADSLRALAENPPTTPTRLLRILLLARTASWESGWLAQFKPGSTLEAAQPLSSFFAPEEPIQLEPLTAEDRIRIFEQAYHKAAKALNLPTHPLDHSAFETRHANETLQDPLTLMMAAVVGLRSGVPNALSLTRIGLAYQSADLLVSQRLNHAFPENPALAWHMAAYATLTGGLSHPEALAALETESEANHLGSAPNPSGFLDRLCTWLPAKIGNGLGAIEPDIIGEAFLLGQPVPRLMNPQATVLRAIRSPNAQVIQFLIRATQDFCLAEVESRTEPLEWLETLIAKGKADDPSLLLQIDAALPEYSVVLRPHALSVRQRIAELYRELAKRDRDAFLSDLARSLNNLANRQRDVGQREEALETAQEAVKLYRELAQRNRDAFLPALAMSLSTLAVMQSEVGQRKEALETAQEAVKLWRELAQHNRDRFLRYLALSLNNLANRQSEMGQRGEALETAQEAVTLRRELAQRNRDAFLPDLAMSLNNLANRQSEVGQHAEALETAQEAVKLYRELAQSNRDAFLPDLAMSLNNLSNRQSEVGQPREA